MKLNKLRIIPLGGVEEVGKNCTVFEYGNDIIVVDLGIDFPGPDLPGVDYILPDISYLEKNKKRIRGIVITHGHLDHIGAIPYLIDRLGRPPIFATKLTNGLIQNRLEERGLKGQIKLNVLDPARSISCGVFKITPFRVVHNIPDSVGLAIETPVGMVVHTGDFKFDPHPVDQKLAEKGKLARLGRKGVLVLLSDSTNAQLPGKTISEKRVGQVIDSIFRDVRGRIIFTTFSTLISRIQQVIDVAQKYKRKIAIAGLSIKKTTRVAQELGYLNIPANLFIDIRRIKKYPDKQLVILASGAQATERSAMTRIAQGIHREVKIKRGDTVVFSSSAIPGNELAIHKVMNDLIDQGARIIYQPVLGLGVHSSGHGYQEDLKEMLRLVRPKFFIPIEGEHYMQTQHIELAEKTGVKKQNTFMLDNGEVLEIDEAKQARLSGERVVDKILVVEGKKIKVLREDVLKARKKMAESGICVIIIARNRVEVTFRGLSLEGRLVAETRNKVKKLIKKYRGRDKKEPKMKKRLEGSIGDFLLNKISKKPLIIVEIL